MELNQPLSDATDHIKYSTQGPFNSCSGAFDHITWFSSAEGAYKSCEFWLSCDLSLFIPTHKKALIWVRKQPGFHPNVAWTLVSVSRKLISSSLRSCEAETTHTNTHTTPDRNGTKSQTVDFELGVECCLLSAWLKTMYDAQLLPTGVFVCNALSI